MRILMSIIAALICIMVLAVIMPHVFAEETGKELVLIVNKDFPFKEKISVDLLKKIFLGKINLEQSIKIFPANQQNLEISKKFLDIYVGMSPVVYRNYLVKMLYSEGIKIPKIMKTPADMIKYVKENEGGIGYVWKTDLPDNEKDIKIITIEMKGVSK